MNALIIIVGALAVAVPLYPVRIPQALCFEPIIHKQRVINLFNPVHK
jgi:hypothetical protein